MLRALKSAEAIARHRSYRRAAQSLGMSQSQLTRIIQGLERELGVKLFDRDRVGATPTPAGAQVLGEIGTFLTAEQAFVARVAAIRNRTDGSVRLGVGAIVSQSWLTAAIAGVARKHPTISIGVRELDWWRLAAAVPGDEFELVIGECSEAERDPDIVVERFPERRAGFYVRSGHPLDEREALTIEDLAAFPLAAPRLPSRISQFLPAKSKLGQVSKGGDHFIPMIEAAAPRSIIDLVLASDAIGMSLAPFCAEALAAGKVVELPLRPPWLCIRQGIMHARGRILSGASLAFRAAAKAAERKYFTDGAAP